MNTASSTPWRAYWLLVGAGFRRQSTYAMAMWSGLATNVVFGLIRASVLGGAALSAGGILVGYTFSALMTYVWLGQALLGSVNLWGRTDLSERIKSGDITAEFLRPLSLIGSNLATDVGGALFVLIPRGVPALVVGYCTFGLTFSSSPLNWVLAIPSVLIAIVLSQVSVYCVALLGFWVVETRGLMAAYALLGSFFAGLAIPIRLFPDWLRLVANTTPFPSMLQGPIDVISGRVANLDAVATVGTQLVWLMVMVVLAWWVCLLGRRHVEVQGG